MSTVKVVMVFDGGVVQNILTDSPDVRVVVVDYDHESYDEDKLMEIPQGDGSRPERGYIAEQSLEVDRAETERMFAVALGSRLGGKS